ncbi:MAG: hypothetical protein AB7Y46_11410 [Armatimonadota bacterium]
MYTLAFLMLVFVAPWWYAYRKTESDLARELERLRELGQPLALAEAAPKPVPDDENAALIYQQAFAGGIDDLDSLALSSFLAHGTSVEQARAQLARPGIAEALALLERASLMPDCAFNVAWEDSPDFSYDHIAQLRRATRAVVARAKLSALDGDPHGALRWLAVATRMSSHMLGEPGLIPWLHATAMQTVVFRCGAETLQRARASPEALDELLVAVRATDVQRGYVRALQAQRAVALDVYRAARERPAWLAAWFEDVDERHAADVVRLLSLRVCRPWLNANCLVSLKISEERISHALAGSGAPYPADDARAYPAALFPLARVILAPPAFQRRDECMARHSVMTVALEVELFRSRHGRYPSSLDELQGAAGYALPADWFTRKPLAYRTSQESFVLYSLGPDRDDDGGAPWDAPAEDGDIAWRHEP